MSVINSLKKNNYVDLFCGAGGLSIGLSRAGFDLCYANDVDRESINTFKHNLNMIHPNLASSYILENDITDLYKALGTTRVYRKKIGLKMVETDKAKSIIKNKKDVTDQDIEVLESVQNLDLLCGGPPCQGFSMIGRSKRGRKSKFN